MLPEDATSASFRGRAVGDNPTEKSLCICILFGVVVTQVYTCVKIHRT